MENEYADKVINAIFNKVKEKYGKIKINDNVSFEVRKFNRFSEYKLSEYKLHELLNTAGYKVSGEILVSALVYLPSIEEPNNVSTDKLFRFVFKDTLVRFDEESEMFQICDDISVSHITLINNIFCK